MPQQVGLDGSLIIGAKRSMTNPVINRNHHVLGRSATAGQKEAELVHGTAVKRDNETAGSLMYNWTQPSPQRKEIDHGRNFMKLNKMAVEAKASDCPHVSQFRATTDARIISRPGDLLRLKNQAPLKLDPDQVFGASSQHTNASMMQLLANNYETEWVNEQLERERRQQKKDEMKASLRNARRGHPDKELDASCSLPSISPYHVQSR